MDILKNNEDGFSVIETLVSLVILGIIISLSILVYNRTVLNPKLILRNEANTLAVQEMDYVLQNKRFSDTTYSTQKKNLIVERKIIENNNLIRIDISVLFAQDNSVIVKLSALNKK